MEENKLTASPNEEIAQPEVEWTHESVVEDDTNMGEDNDIVIDVVPPAPTNSRRKQASIENAIDASVKGGNPFIAYRDAYLSEDAKLVGERFRATVEPYQTILDASQELGEGATAAAITQFNERAKAPTIGAYKAYVDSLPGALTMTNKERDSVASDLCISGMAATTFDETSVPGLIGDFLTLGFLPTTNITYSHVAERVGVEFGPKDYLDTTEFQVKFIEKLNTLPVEDRVAIVDDIVAHWEEISPTNNKLELIDFITKLVNVTSSDVSGFQAENVLERVDQSTSLFGVGKLTAGISRWLIKKATILRTLSKLRDIEGVRDAAKLAMRGELVEAGVDPLDGAVTSLPLNNLESLAQGANPKVASEILDIDKQVDELVKITETQGLPLNKDDVTKIIDKTIKDVEADKELTNVRVASVDEKGVTIAYDGPDGAQTFTRKFTIDDVGSWSEADMEAKVGSFIWSPKHRLFKLREDLINIPRRGILAGAKFSKNVRNIMRNSYYGLDKAAAQRVDEILMKGSKQAKVYSYTDAVEIGIDGVKLTPKEYRAYAGARKVYDGLHAVMEKQIKENWAINGVKKIRFKETEMAGKPYDTAGDAIKGYNQGTRYSNWYIDENGKVVTKALTREAVDEAYAKGYRLVHTDNVSLGKTGAKDTTASHNFFNVDDVRTEWAFVKADDISDVTGNVLPKLTGYVTRIREGANFFLKRKVKSKVGDKDIEYLSTESYSANYNDLEAYRKTLDNPDDYVIRYDRQMSAEELDSDHIRIMGGLFTGKRKAEPLLNIDGLEGTTKTALESLSRYVDRVAMSVPLSTFRQGLKQKWLNTALESKVIRNYTGTESFSELGAKIDPTHPKARFFDQSFKEVAFIAGVKSKEEAFWDANIFRLGKFIESKNIPFGKKVASGIYKGKLNDVTGAIKTATYATMLGMGNVAQYFIQGSGAALALSINPVHGVKGVQSALEFMILDQLGKKAPIEQFAKHFDVDCWKLWDESGLRESVISTNLDYGTVFSDAPYDVNLVRRALTHHDFFAKSGEMVYARTSFGTAYDYMAKKLGRLPTKKDLPAIVERADMYMLDMSRANTSKFQKGLAGIPTQFMQVQTKFVEKLLGEELTTPEKLRLTGAQMALYGSVGVPFFGTIMPVALDYLGINAEDYTPEELSVIKKGITGYLLSNGTGANIDFSGRVALGNDLAERLLQVTVGTANPLELLAGPSASVLGKGMNVVETANMVSKFIYHADDIDDTLLLAAASVVGKEIANIPASTRNLLKGYTMYNSGAYKDRNGRTVFEYRDNSFLASLGAAMGFQNKEIAEFYDLTSTTDMFSNVKVADDYATLLAGTFTKLMNASDNDQAMYGIAHNILLSSVVGKEGGDKVYKSFLNKLKDKNTPWNTAILKAADRYGNEWAEGWSEVIRQSKLNTSEVLAEQFQKLKGNE